MKNILQVVLFAAFCINAYLCLTMVNDISVYVDITKTPFMAWVSLITGLLVMFTATYGVYLVETKLITKGYK